MSETGIDGVAACAECRVALAGPVNPSPDDLFRCPSCGIEESREVIARELQAQLVDYAKARLNAGLGSSSRTSSPFLKITTTPFKREAVSRRFMLLPTTPE